MKPVPGASYDAIPGFEVAEGLVRAVYPVPRSPREVS